ncbi:MAG: hypothetical protein P4L84_37050 [Isosphaeraceae bacterium]|nr:hypothetical protein [Isosphaeraceae bacterium]
MSNYVPWYGKKREKLAEKKRKLRRILQHGGNERELERAAEEVRVSMVRFLRAERARIPQCGVHQARLTELDHKINACESMPIADILASYGVTWSRQPENRGHSN